MVDVGHQGKEKQGDSKVPIYMNLNHRHYDR